MRPATNGVFSADTSSVRLCARTRLRGAGRQPAQVCSLRLRRIGTPLLKLKFAPGPLSFYLKLGLATEVLTRDNTDHSTDEPHDSGDERD